MSLLGDVYILWRNGDLEYAISLFKKKAKETDYGNDLNRQMKLLGLTGLGKNHDSIFELFPPAFHTGCAVEFANHYGVEFHIGTCHAGCRAVLPRHKWKRKINTSVPLEELACFLVPKSYEEIDRFQGLSLRLEFAICECLIMARKAGVI